MSCFTIRLTSRAAREIERGARWWRKNRDKAPAAFEDDVHSAIAAVRENPRIGVPIRARRIGVRALWLERIGYLLYYRELPGDVVEILAIWHASRGRRPRL